MSKLSMADVAKAAGVSKNTVSLALRGSPRISANTRQRIAETARLLGYQLNPTVAHLMAEMRKNQTPGFQATLAMMNANEDPEAFSHHPTIPAYVMGGRTRAAQLGYRLDEFWLHQPEMPAARWLAMLRARYIRGIVMVGLMHRNRLPAHLAPLWQEFPVVVTGVRTREPALSHACCDHHSLALVSFEKAVELGYRRPALVLDGVIDQLIEGRFTAGFLAGQSRLQPYNRRIEPFFEVAAAREDRSIFFRWLEKSRPDVIFTLYHEVRHWIEEAGKRVPEDIGLIQYEWRSDHATWAGMNQRNDLVGEAAVDMLVSMIHRHEQGVPEHPRATLIGSHWVDGETVKASMIEN